MMNCAHWPERKEERERGRQEDLCVLDEEIQRRLVALTTDFKTLWLDPGVPNRERKRLLACIIEDATLVKSPEDWCGGEA